MTLLAYLPFILRDNEEGQREWRGPYRNQAQAEARQRIIGGEVRDRLIFEGENVNLLQVDVLVYHKQEVVPVTIAEDGQVKGGEYDSDFFDYYEEPKAAVNDP